MAETTEQRRQRLAREQRQNSGSSGYTSQDTGSSFVDTTSAFTSDSAPACDPAPAPGGGGSDC